MKYRAVQLCAHRQPVTLIHGPPGTGKTATLAAAIISAAVNGDRVLVTAPSHAACDAVTAAVAKRWCHKALGRAEDGNLLRLANPLRLTDFSMSKYVVALESRRGTYKEAHDRVSAVKASLFREKNKKKLAALLDEFNRELGNVRRERTRCENAAVSNAKVVVCTNNHACNMSSNRKSGFNVADFDLVCYDEAGFALDTEVLPAVLASRRIIMSGDHLQLPPVVLSREAKNGGLDVSLFEKLCRSMTDNVVLLNKQFRANALISGWSSKFFYNSLVVADSSVASIALHDLPGVRETAETRTNLLFLDTASEGYTETQVEDDRSEEDPAPRAREEEESIANHEEALVVEMLLRKFLHLGVAASDVGVISPYWAQVALLRHLIWSDAACRNVEVRTVDGYQGREKELILLSLVRSNAEKTVGFLRESRFATLRNCDSSVFHLRQFRSFQARECLADPGQEVLHRRRGWKHPLLRSRATALHRLLSQKQCDSSRQKHFCRMKRLRSTSFKNVLDAPFCTQYTLKGFGKGFRKYIETPPWFLMSTC